MHVTCSVWVTSQINYTQIVNVFCLHKRIEPSAVLFCTRAYIETVDPARRPSILQVRQGSVRLSEEEPPPSPFPFLLYTYAMGYMLGNMSA